MAKSTTPIPPGYHALTPHIMVDGAAKFIDFLKSAFDAQELTRSPGPGGKIMHASVRVGDSVLMFSDDFSAEFNMPPFAKGNLPFVMHLYVPNVDEVFAKAVAAGCQVVMPVSDQFWGDRYGHVKDPFGLTWAIATHMEDLTPAEIQERQAKTFGHHG